MQIKSVFSREIVISLLVQGNVIWQLAAVYNNFTIIYDNSDLRNIPKTLIKTIMKEISNDFLYDMFPLI